MLAILFSAATAAPVDGQQHVEIVLAKYDEGVEWANKYKDKAKFVCIRPRLIGRQTLTRMSCSVTW